ncbi:MAG: DUF2207 domain-containing protein, partial [Eubacteriaceae bacterium]|nr:DUF2207 domain-containing protein [Eubacteriaceae bacterium]
MKRKCIVFFVALVLCCLLFPASAFAEEGGYTTQSYNVNVNVNENHSYDVTETINVTFLEARHGIYRYIPESGSFYREINGTPTESTYHAVIKNVKVEGDKFDTSSENNNTVIKIGDADETVTGPKTYTLSYTWDPGDDGIDDFDDMYFNVLPYNWPTAIDNASFTVNMPKDFDASQLNLYAGDYGAVNGNQLTYQVNGRTISGNTTSPLNAKEGVTINLRL